MADDLDKKLKARYGQDRFNPAGGQSQMSEQEWIDRHPALKGRSDLKERYQKAVSAEGGAAYQKKNPDWRTKVVKAPKGMTSEKLTALGKLVQPDEGPDHRAAAERMFARLSNEAWRDSARKRKGVRPAGMSGSSGGVGKVSGGVQSMKPPKFGAFQTTGGAGMGTSDRVNQQRPAPSGPPSGGGAPLPPKPRKPKKPQRGGAVLYEGGN